MLCAKCQTLVYVTLTEKHKIPARQKAKYHLYSLSIITKNPKVGYMNILDIHKVNHRLMRLISLYLLL